MTDLNTKDLRTEFKFENYLELKIVAMGASNPWHVSVIAQNDAPLQTSFTWQVTEARAKELHIGQLIRIGLAVEGEQSTERL